MNREQIRRSPMVSIILDAILPQVTTVAELARLRDGTKLLGRDGNVWWRRSSMSMPWQGSGGGFGETSGDFTEICERFLAHEGPLTVVWRPES